MLARFLAAAVILPAVASAVNLVSNSLLAKGPSVVELNNQSVVAAESSPQIGTYKLRLCNAYASSNALELSRLEEPMIVEYPLPYKQCHDYMLPLKEGNQLQFRAGDQQVGIFTVTGLPADTQDTLMLIPHLRDSTATDLTFNSHMFHHSADTAQVAIVDAYRGPAHSTLLLEEPARQEELSFDAVISVHPGEYNFVLKTVAPPNVYCPSNGYCRKPSRRAHLAVQAQESYLVMRVGTDSKIDPSFPEELIVFPELSRSGSIGNAGASAWLLGLLILWRLT